MKRSKNNSHELLLEKVASVLAGYIIRIQFRLSARLNKSFNACSVRQKKSITVVTVLLTSVGLIAGSFCSFYTIPKLSQNYTSVHIGMASDHTKARVSKRQLTDSLTIKK